ncbi:MAG TPA: hypothetical protein P5230_01570, partial [Candidatus Magasanikbacteria bacterium]|nr:hypothetical protein [Candidatus Magasanikbacteria bacterium]
GEEGEITSHAQECMNKEKYENIDQSPETKHLVSVKKMIMDAELKSGDEQELAEFEKRKEEVNRLLAEIIKKTSDYKKTIMYLKKQHEAVGMTKSNSKDDIKEYQEEHERLGKSRTASHNVLLDAIKKTIRYINFNFGDINRNLLDKWEEEQEERGNMVLDVKRIKFPKNIICPDDVNLDDRKSLGAWAIKLTDVLK